MTHEVRMNGKSFQAGLSKLNSSGGKQSAVDAEKLFAIVNDTMHEQQPLSTAGIDAMFQILNPCGELGSHANSQYPDGALPQSAVWEFRQVDTITPPFQSISEISLGTNNWSLVIISPPCIKTQSILIACRNAVTPSDTIIREIYTAINNSVENPIFPTWGEAGPSDTSGPLYYYSLYQYRSANLAINARTGESDIVESFRIVGDGMVVMHNTPTLFDQGTLAVGQFQSNTEVSGTENDTPTATSGFYLVNRPSADTATYEYRIDAKTSSGDVRLFISPQFTLGAADSTQTWTIDRGALAPYALSTLPPEEKLFLDLITANTATLTATYVAATGIVTVVQAGGPDTEAQLYLIKNIAFLEQVTATFIVSGPFAVSIGSGNSQVIWTTPNIDQSMVAQADPLFSAELMKMHCGFYAVRRVFQPVLGMAKANEGGSIKMLYPGMNIRDVSFAAGGIEGDLIDKNFGVVIAVIKGISWAAQPQIVCNRYVEFVPAPGDNVTAPFVKPCPPLDEDAIAIIRSMQESGPHSYIPDANMVGTLGALIATIVSNLPAFLRGTKAAASAVSTVATWAEGIMGV